MSRTVIDDGDTGLVIRESLNNMTAELYQSTALTQRRLKTMVVGAVGDSITAQGVGGAMGDGITGGTTRFNNGYTTWLPLLSEGRIRIPTSMIIAIGGSTTEQIEGFLDTMLALPNKPDAIIINAGANLTNTMVETVSRMINKCFAKNVLPWLSAPLGNTENVGSEGIQRQSEYISFLRALDEGRSWALALIGSTETRQVPLITDPRRRMLDLTSDTQHKIDPRNGDLHPGGTGAFNTATAMWETVKHMFAPRYLSIDPADTFHGTYNPHGTLLPGTLTNMSGTGGSHNAGWSGANTTFTGTVPTGLEIKRSPGTGSTMTMVASRVPLSGYFNANALRLVVDVTAPGSAGTYERVQMATGFDIPAGLQVGDIVEFEAWYQLTGTVSKVRSIEVEAFQNGGGDFATDGKQSGGTDQVIAGTAFPQVAHKAVLRTPPIVIKSTNRIDMSISIFMENYEAGGHVELETVGWSFRRIN